MKVKQNKKSLAVQSFYGTRAMQTKFLLSTRTLQLHWKISMNQFAKAQKTGPVSLYLEHFLSLNLTAQNLVFCFEIFKHTHPAIMHKK